MLTSRFVVGIFSVGLVVLGADRVSGQNFPNKPIRIVTANAGGGADFVARQVAQGISGPLGQPVIVENRPAAIGSEIVAKAPADGYTLHVAGASLWLIPLLQKAPYDAISDFLSISLISKQFLIVAVHPSVPAKSVSELIALAKSRPGELNYSSANTGGTSHLAGALLASMANVNIVHVPFKGGALAIAALIRGEVQLTIVDVSVVTPHVKSGRLKALAVTSATPSALVPGLPTVAASGVPGYESVGMTGIHAPAKTPEAIINRLNQEVVRFLSRADVKERFLAAGEEIVGSSPQEFATIIRADIAKMGKVIKDAGIKAD